MASRLLNRSKTLTLTITRNLLRPYYHADPIASSHFLRPVSSLGKLQPSDSRSEQSGPVHSPAVSSILNSRLETSKKVGGIEGDGVNYDNHSEEREVICFSPLEAVATKPRTSILHNESSKIKRTEQSINITYALIPPLLLLSKTPLTTSLLIFTVYWQIYGFFKEIILDYVHQEVTRKWVLVYFKVLLLILAKDTFVNFCLF